MRKRDKDQYTREAVEAKIKSLKDELVRMLVRNADNFDNLKLNTVDVQQKIGALKALEEVLYI